MLVERHGPMVPRVRRNAPRDPHDADDAFQATFLVLAKREVSRLTEIHQALRPGDVLVGDRGFCSFAHVAALASTGIDVMFRVNTRRIVDFTPSRPHAHPDDDSAKAKGLPRSRWLRALGGADQIVEWLKPARQAPWMSAADYAALPESVAVRELRYRVERRGFRTQTVIVVTTLLDAEAFPAEALAELNGARWRVEQDLKDLKQTMGMTTLKCKSVEGVLKELTAYAIVYNLVRAVIGEAARRQGVPVDRISFIDALRWLRARVGGIDDRPPRLVVVPLRPGRVEPRAVKRRPQALSPPDQTKGSNAGTLDAPMGHTLSSCHSPAATFSQGEKDDWRKPV